MAKSIVNYVFVHDRNIKNLFMQKSLELKSNMFYCSKFVCCRDPELTDFEKGDDIINLYNEKYKDLNGIIRLITGIMEMFNRPDMTDPYDFIGIQRCSVVYGFDFMDALDQVDESKLYFAVTKKQTITRFQNMLQWKSDWWDKALANLDFLFKKMQTVQEIDQGILEFVDWFYSCSDRFQYLTNFIVPRKMLGKIKEIQSESLLLWEKIRVVSHKIQSCDSEMGLDLGIVYSLDMYDAIQEYFYCKNIGVNNMEFGQMKVLYRFEDDKYHCRCK